MQDNLKNKPEEEVKQENQAIQEDSPEASPKISTQEESFKDKFLALSADFENFKRRIEKERREWMNLAQISVLEDLLPIFDELDRAIAFSEQEATDEKTQKWLEGFKLIQKTWNKKLTEMGIKEIDTSGEFNPEFHEALMQAESTEKSSGSIVQTLAKGYTFKDKVIRHAKVSVAK